MQGKNVKIFKLSLLLILACLITCLPISEKTAADDCNMGRTPDGVYPMYDSSITMVSEDVSINLATGNVQCIFVFRNDGPAKDVLMGFPGVPIIKDEENQYLIEERGSIRNFAASDNGTPLSVKMEKHNRPTNYSWAWDMEYADWYTFMVHFESQETKTVSNSYQVKNTVYSNGDIVTGYVITTGKAWKDNIGQARISFELGDVKPYEILWVKPDRFIYKGNSLLWQDFDFEPESDLAICYNQCKYKDEYLNHTSEEFKYETIKKLAGFEQILDNFESLELDELQELLETMKQEQEEGMALFLASRINQLDEYEKHVLVKDSDNSFGKDNKGVSWQSKPVLITVLIILAVSLFIIIAKRK
jgi:hypothetical protein